MFTNIISNIISNINEAIESQGMPLDEKLKALKVLHATVQVKLADIEKSIEHIEDERNFKATEGFLEKLTKISKEYGVYLEPTDLLEVVTIGEQEEKVLIDDVKWDSHLQIYYKGEGK